jgi:hypothetical protein
MNYDLENIYIMFYNSDHPFALLIWINEVLLYCNFYSIILSLHNNSEAVKGVNFVITVRELK